MSQDPFVYLEVDGLRPVERTMRGRALRLAVHVPDTDRCVEFAITRDGRWTVAEGPDAAHAGGFEPRAEGRLSKQERECPDCEDGVITGLAEIPGGADTCARCDGTGLVPA